jgi:cell division protein ZapB
VRYAAIATTGAHGTRTYNDRRGVGAEMGTLQDLAERIDRLVLRHEELKRSNALLEQQLAAVSAERDSLRSRLAAARGRIDTLLARLPADAKDAKS